MRRSAALLAVALTLAACGGSAPAGGPTASPSAVVAQTGAVAPAVPSESPPASPSGADVFAPRPNVPLPERAAAIAAALEQATGAVRRSVDAWVRTGDTSTWPPPGTLVLQALFQQRIYRDLAGRPAVASRVFAMLPGSIRAEAKSIVHANAAVFAHANPVPPSYRMVTRPPPPPDALLRYYRQAEGRFGVPWEILAAVNYVETKFGRVVSNSSAGAQGPMQFLPSTWASYGLGGDIHDPHDAILGAANYLHANGAPANIRGALYHYNPVDAYVDAVATYAGAIRRDPRLFYDLYCWQVYMLTTRGDRRVTGPGL
ncbi:MAG: lytic murein transglycosylase [Actinomycetota bacterium]